MTFTNLLYIALALFGLGFLFKIGTWLWIKPGLSAPDAGPFARLKAMCSGLVGVLFSRKLFVLAKVFVLDVLLQRRVWTHSRLAWVMHILIYLGFFFLLFFHALGVFISAPLFGEDYSNLNPMFFLRDFAGLLVIAGVGIAIYRRASGRISRFSKGVSSGPMDIYAIMIVALIIGSGVLWLGAKIASHSAFMDMVEFEAGLDPVDDAGDISALEAVWVKDFGKAPVNVSPPFDQETLDLGREVHENYCMDCHVSTKWSPTAFVAAKAMGPAARYAASRKAVNFFKWLHLLACLIGLAYLPFSKMFHIFTTPLSLLANAVMDEKSNPLNVATRQALELDACTHCGACSEHCSAMMGYEATGNSYVLPSEKMQALKKLVKGKSLDPAQQAAVSQGLYLCTNCERCTLWCPSGINLRDLWTSVREDVVRHKAAEPMVLSPLSFQRGILRPEFCEDDYAAAAEQARKLVAGRFAELGDPQAEITLDTDCDQGETSLADHSFAACFGCQTCTTVCPVVGEYDNPGQSLGLAPHQIMCALGLGLTELASGAPMIWECVTCYLCQENCPQQVDVVDLLYGLKNMAMKRVYAQKQSAGQSASLEPEA